MKKIISIVLFLIIQISSYSFEDNYVFNAERIKKVFSEWDFVNEKKSENHYMRFINREKDITIDISNYKKGDTPETAERRFHKSALEDDYIFNGNGLLSVKYLGTASKEYTKYTENGIEKEENFFFEKVKFAIFHTNSEENYKETLELVKEAIDPSMKVKNRPKKVFKKPLEIDQIFDVKKLKREFDNTHKFVELKKNADPSGIMLLLDEKKAGFRRQIIIESNNNFSKEVITKRRDYSLKLGDDDMPGYKYIKEDKKSEKYFGVPSREYQNTYFRDKKIFDVIVMANVIVTDQYGILIINYIPEGQKEFADKQYEEYLKILSSCLKK
ncbi:hypothetical protein [Fusobacterium varium]|jgi:hypothetical protein|uniref:DUF4837 domain-containing protein n=1 Tax=Fusobacterium varium ATCC 27725 TaxID=469618 RepID=A0ABN5JK54_FUSVA|nr:hypothetical protein [Fusobacterium varium]AVQ32045.1 hypothetical protein C4N18_12730 [Fusobacterium varium ATCC 27725]EES63406.1 hypothetical protein FVAG_01095 [Fusobacterium varium ATCC 27725]VEH39076.1 Uncharacterised protein [Fusobacterium varium]